MLANRWRHRTARISFLLVLQQSCLEIYSHCTCMQHSSVALASRTAVWFACSFVRVRFYCPVVGKEICVLAEHVCLRSGRGSRFVPWCSGSKLGSFYFRFHPVNQIRSRARCGDFFFCEVNWILLLRSFHLVRPLRGTYSRGFFSRRSTISLYLLHLLQGKCSTIASFIFCKFCRSAKHHSHHPSN